MANVILDSVAGTARDKEHTVWKVHLRAGRGGGENEKWFQIQDLIVEEIQKEMIFLGESVLQVSTPRVIKGLSLNYFPWDYRYGNAGLRRYLRRPSVTAVIRCTFTC